VLSASVVQFVLHLGESLVRDFVLSLLLPGLRDLVILAIDAAKIAVAEKDISSTFRPRQAWFLTEVRSVGRDDRQAARVARRYFVFEAIVAAVFGTNRARGEQRFQLLDPLVQFIRPQEF
jgi:hypothetical protein